MLKLCLHRQQSSLVDRGAAVKGQQRFLLCGIALKALIELAIHGFWYPLPLLSFFTSSSILN